LQASGTFGGGGAAGGWEGEVAKEALPWLSLQAQWSVESQRPADSGGR
jgi:hypothetical protein